MKSSPDTVISHPRRISLVIWFMVFIFVSYFGYLALARLWQLWASYFDMGIMHQTVYNSYQALRTGEWGRFLELTDPHDSGLQIKRMAIHQDILLGLLAPLYFIHAGPETLIIVQLLVVVSGVYPLYQIARTKLSHTRSFAYAPVLIVGLYFLYPALGRSILYEFHAVTLATGLILWMYHFAMMRRYVWAGIFYALILLTKEQLGFSLGMWLVAEYLKDHVPHWHRSSWRAIMSHRLSRRDLFLMGGAIGTFVFTLLVVFAIMPSYRMGDGHFALSYFGKDTASPISTILGHAGQLLSYESIKYITYLAGHFLFLPFASWYILPALPDLLINLLSSSSSMRSLYFHYTAVITPWLFIAYIDALVWISQRWRLTKTLIIVCTIMHVGMWGYLAYLDSPLPFSQKSENTLLGGPPAAELKDIELWRQILARDTIPVASTGQFAPYLTSRRYFYTFGKHYPKADYVLLRLPEVYTYPEKDTLIPLYEQLQKDTRFRLVYKNGDIEVYKRLQSK